MTNLTEIQSRVSTLLMDSTRLIWSDDVLAESIRQALEEYNLVKPFTAEACFPLENPEQEIALSALSGFREIIGLRYPWVTEPDRQQPSNLVRGWHTWFAGGQPFAAIRSAGRLPAGKTLRVLYLASHTLAGLDGAAVTTVPAEHNGLLVRGAAGLAALSRGIDKIELRSYGSRRAEPELLSRWGASQMASFRSSLSLLRESLPPFATPRWQLDRWESQEMG